MIETFLNLLEEDGVKVRRIGKHYRGRCPFHSGKTSIPFMVDPETGTYHCHGCGKHGDAIQYLRDTRGLSFLEACATLRIESGAAPLGKHLEERSKPFPSLKWQVEAEGFLKESIESLWRSGEVLSYLNGRGLRNETIRAAGLGWNLMDRYEDRESWGLQPVTDEKGKVKKLWLPAGLVVPLLASADEDRGFDSLGAVVRLRIRRPNGEPRYYIISGSDMRPMTFHLDREVLNIVESELDGLLINQEARDLVGVIALGSVSIKPDEEVREVLNRADLIMVSLDFDEAGAKSAWQYWLTNYPNARRWPVPIGKDPSEAFQKGLNIRSWVEVGLTYETSSRQAKKVTEGIIKPFPSEWLQRFDEAQLERLAIMTVDGRLSDQEALRLMN